ncbi:MAG TPA: Sel1-like repeat-containing protein kinase family protein [Polyangiaceae bacterium]|nr:Sel1-like repeat-containing protein kinase family protein [Polyangiaceae bacterium]
MSARGGLAVGAPFGNDYLVQRPLREGEGWGVYEVEQQSTGRFLVLEAFAPSVATTPDAKAKFVESVRKVGRLGNDRLVAYLAAGVDERSGRPFLVRDHLDGADLAAALANYQGDWPLPIWDEVLGQLCQALEAMHNAGLVHGGVNPETVFLSLPGRGESPFFLQLLDVGLPASVHEAVDRAPDRALWAAPEVLAGQAPVKSSDVWSLGLIAFALVCGRPYWTSTEREALAREIKAGPVEQASARVRSLGLQARLPKWFDNWFARCVAPDPAARFPDAASAYRGASELFKEAKVLDEFDVQEDNEDAAQIAARIAQNRPKPPPLLSMMQAIARNPKPAIAALLALVAIALGGGIGLGRLMGGSDAAKTARTKALRLTMGDPAEAEKGCNGGDAVACHALGLVFRGGLKGTRDDARAATFFRKACEGDDVAACNELAQQYALGEGVAEDKARAASLYQKACDGDDGVSCFDLANVYRQGLGVAKDPAKAADLQKRACERGVTEACAQ